MKKKIIIIIIVLLMLLFGLILINKSKHFNELKYRIPNEYKEVINNEKYAEYTYKNNNSDIYIQFYFNKSNKDAKEYLEEILNEEIINNQLNDYNKIDSNNNIETTKISNIDCYYIKEESYNKDYSNTYYRLVTKKGENIYYIIYGIHNFSNNNDLLKKFEKDFNQFTKTLTF